MRQTRQGKNSPLTTFNLVSIVFLGDKLESGHSCPPFYLVLTVALQAQLIFLECGASAAFFSHHRGRREPRNTKVKEKTQSFLISRYVVKDDSAFFYVKANPSL